MTIFDLIVRGLTPFYVLTGRAPLGLTLPTPLFLRLLAEVRATRPVVPWVDVYVPWGVLRVTDGGSP